ncbi:Glyoxylate/hydroxypyruvate reductase (D-isomer-specific 2-hydroxy acid dehydrogenase superfamily) [Ceraceosorus bombacis]|uniref:Glyoxylate/hydroxypyruvate reductase (D-isomer-specific 2-hydroxy acid dehydrogenase superfamily) n=1 Tax=Ceraceosorus bombacis TaxID=401625 RepID=A0A0N7L9S2_9BASI|nr:Glyoxylate/hydroxypyruvate reductase (D-isomer-specific 2-hydroxy acid dehydrogenase superfamily) [Ceraceosorus bombacis]
MTHTASSSRPKVVLTRPLPTCILDEARAAGAIDLTVWKDADRPADREWLLRSAEGADAVLVMMSDKVDAELLDRAGPSLKIVSCMSVGYDHVDTAELKRRGIQLGHTPDVLNAAVADLVLLLILSTTRLLPNAKRTVDEGRWPQTPWAPLSFAGPSLQGKTIGFVGFGAIAQSTLLRLLPLGPSRYIYLNSSPQPFDLDNAKFAALKAGGLERLLPAYEAVQGSRISVENARDLEDLARQSDVIVVLASLNAKTKHLIDGRCFDHMKPTAHLVNAARGPLVNTSALVSALQQGKMAGAGLDVLEGEPVIGATHPLLSDESIRDKVCLLPHIGSATLEARRGMSELAVANVLHQLGFAHLVKGRGSRLVQL